MKACPFCEAELRDSVIRCTRCGRSLRGDPEPEPEPLGAPVVSVGAGAARDPRQGPSHTSVKNPWTTPATRAGGPSASSIPEIALRRALPTERRRSGRPDWALWLAGLIGIAAGAIAWGTMRLPWVHLRVTHAGDPTDRLDPTIAADLTLRGKTALVGTIGLGLAAAMMVFGALWLLYGINRGSSIPWFSNPAFAIGVSLAGVGATVLAAMLWFVWKDAMIEHARAARLSAEAMRDLLDRQPAPAVEIERLTGLLRFGGSMALGFLGSSLGWWAYRKRG